MTKPVWADFSSDELLTLIDAMAAEFWVDKHKLKILALDLRWKRRQDEAKSAAERLDGLLSGYRQHQTIIAFERYRRASAASMRADHAATAAFDALMAAYGEARP